MKTACFIPIKENSERIQGKNFRVLNGKKLYEYIITHTIESECFDDIYIDTNSEEIKEYALSKNLKIIERLDSLAQNTANGNDLINYHMEKFPDYDYYFQLFATAPYLQVSSIRDCFNTLTTSETYDSCFTALKRNGFFWFNCMPINYRPEILPRSQDITNLAEETTGLYGISKKSLKKYRCRIGSRPYIKFVGLFEAVDINTEEDLKIAEVIGKSYWGYCEQKEHDCATG